MTQPTNMQVSKDDGGTLYTTKLNEILSAHTTMFAGPSAPVAPVPFMLWQDTSVDPPREYRRNATNSGWDDLGRRGTGQFYGNVTGSAASCATLSTARAIAISGAGTGSASFDGSANATINLTLANSGVTAGTYGSATHIPVPVVNSKGLITGITQVAISKAGLVEKFNGRTGEVSLTTADVYAVLPSKVDKGQCLLGLNKAGDGFVWYTIPEKPKAPKVLTAPSSYAVGVDDNAELILIQGSDTPATSCAISIPISMPPGMTFRMRVVGYPAGVTVYGASGVAFTDTFDFLPQNTIVTFTHLGNNLWDLSNVGIGEGAGDQSGASSTDDFGGAVPGDPGGDDGDDGTSE